MYTGGGKPHARRDTYALKHSWALLGTGLVVCTLSGVLRVANVRAGLKQSLLKHPHPHHTPFTAPFRHAHLF